VVLLTQYVKLAVTFKEYKNTVSATVNFLVERDMRWNFPEDSERFISPSVMEILKATENYPN
jgi:hypothetical protein